MPIIDEGGSSLIPYSNTTEHKCVSYGDLINAINGRVIISCLPTGLPDSNTTAQYTYEQSGALVITDNIPSGFSNNLEFYMLDEEIYSYVNAVGVRVFKDFGTSSQQWLQQYSYTVDKPIGGSLFVFPTSELVKILSLIQSQYYDNNITVMFMASTQNCQYPIILLKYLGQRKYETKFELSHQSIMNFTYYPADFRSLLGGTNRTMYFYPQIRIDSTAQKNMMFMFSTVGATGSTSTGGSSISTTYFVLDPEWNYSPSQILENKTYTLSKIGVTVNVAQQNNIGTCYSAPLYGSYFGTIKDRETGSTVANFTAGQDLYPAATVRTGLYNAPDSALASISGTLQAGHTYDVSMTIESLTPIYRS